MVASYGPDDVRFYGSKVWLAQEQGQRLCCAGWLAGHGAAGANEDQMPMSKSR